MSILQEYEKIRKSIGEEKYKQIEEFLDTQPYDLSDVYYNKCVWDEMEKWVEEKEEFIKKHLLVVENITEDIIEKIDNDEGIIITTKNGRIIDISAVWCNDDKCEDYWDIRIYKSYKEFCDMEYDDIDSVLINELTINHIKRYME